jgi:hypothetical protein
MLGSLLASSLVIPHLLEVAASISGCISSPSKAQRTTGTYTGAAKGCTVAACALAGNATARVIPEARRSQGKKQCAASPNSPNSRHSMTGPMTGPMTRTHDADHDPALQTDRSLCRPMLLNRNAFDVALAGIHMLRPAIIVSDVNPPPLTSHFLIVRFRNINCRGGTQFCHAEPANR